jgi:hypothetical protein
MIRRIGIRPGSEIFCPHNTPSILLDSTPESFSSQSVAVQGPCTMASYADRHNATLSRFTSRPVDCGHPLALG